jgi:hypothetical protein
MKKKLVTQFSYDFELFGLVSRAKDYTLAWHLNQIHDFHFVRKDDLHLEFNQQKKISVLIHHDTSEFYCYELIKNRLLESNHLSMKYFLPELPQFDFFLKLASQLPDFNVNELISSIREIPLVDYIVRIDINKLKQKENLLY